MVDPIFYPDGTVFIPLTKTKFKGVYTKIDFEDFEKVNSLSWTALWDSDTKSYYAYRHVGDAYQKLHRMLLGLTDPKIKVDHLNHDTLDNRKQNLRATNNRGNCQNNTRNKSGYPGVSWSLFYKKWAAFIKIDGKNKNLGRYDLKEDAAAAYRKACQELP